MRIALLFVLPALLISSCAPSLPYAVDYPMTQTLFHSRDSSISGRVPAGWFSSTEDSIAPALAAWLIREDYTATLALRELRLDRLAEDRVRHEGLRLLAGLNASLERQTTSMRDIVEYKMGGTAYCGYEFEAGESPGRVVVFAAKNRYYACTAKRVKGPWTKGDVIGLFRAQQSVLSSLSF